MIHPMLVKQLSHKIHDLKLFLNAFIATGHL